MISTVLFDMNDVLYSYDRSVRVTHIARIRREPTTAVAEAIWELGFETPETVGSWMPTPTWRVLANAWAAH